MVFSMNISPPSRSEIKYVMEMAEVDLDLLDGRDLWIFETCCQGGF